MTDLQKAVDQALLSGPSSEGSKQIIEAAKKLTDNDTSNDAGAEKTLTDAGFFKTGDGQWLHQIRGEVPKDSFLIPSWKPEHQQFLGAVRTLNNPSAWELMKVIEGPGAEHDTVGEANLGKLAQLTPESPEWDQLPADKAVPDTKTRQDMIDAAQLILRPEQTANREKLQSLGANSDRYNKEDWQGWIDASDGFITQPEAAKTVFEGPRNGWVPNDDINSLFAGPPPLFADPNGDGFMDCHEYEIVKNAISKNSATQAGLHFFDANNDHYMTYVEWATRALMECGMACADAERYAPSLSKLAEGAGWGQVSRVLYAIKDLLVAKIKEGCSAGDALLWSIFPNLAGDPQLRKDLSTAFYELGSSVAECNDLALHNLQAWQVSSPRQDQTKPLSDRHGLNGHNNFPDLRTVAGQEAFDLMNESIPLDTLMAVPADIWRAMVSAGLTPVDAAICALHVYDFECAQGASRFLDVLKGKLAEGITRSDAILWARFSGIATDKELKNPEFLKALSSPLPQRPWPYLSSTVLKEHVEGVRKQLKQPG